MRRPFLIPWPLLPLGRTTFRTLIRDPKLFANCVRYIRRNPRHLPKDAFTLWESDRAKSME